MEQETKPQPKRPKPAELGEALRGIARETEKRELEGFGLTPELEAKVESMAHLSKKKKETRIRQDQALEAAKQWLQNNPRYRIKYIKKDTVMEAVDLENLDTSFVDFLINKAAEARGFRGMRFFEEEQIKSVKTLLSKRNIVVAIVDVDGNMAEFYFQQKPPFKLLRVRQVEEDEGEQRENKFNF